MGDPAQPVEKSSVLLKWIFGTGEDTARLVKSTWILAWPVVLEQALAMISQVIDMAMVGRGLGTEAVAAIGLSMQPFFLINALIMGLSVGTTALAARAVGAGNYHEAGKVTGQSLLIAAASGAVVAYVGFIKSDWIITFMKAEDAVRQLGSGYVRAMMPGMLLFFVFTLATGALRGSGDTRSPMIINLSLNVFKVILNYGLIFGHFGLPALGVVGAGISTSIARTLGGVVILIVLTRPGGRLYIRWKEVFRKFDWRLLGRILNVGVPAAMERVLTSSGQIAYSREVASLGTECYSAHAISLNVESFSFMPGIGFATATTALVGQKLGAGDPEGAERSIKASLKMALLSMGSIAMLFLLIPGHLLRIYTNDPTIIALGIPLIRIVAFTQIPECIGFVIPGALRGAGDTRISMYVTVIGIWVVRVGLTRILMSTFNLGLTAAWLAMFMDWMVRATLYIPVEVW